MPKPLPGHPGNVFLAGEEVTIDLPAGRERWRTTDYEGRLVAKGGRAGPIRLGRLPVGYYEIRLDGAGAAEQKSLTAAVLVPLKAPTPSSSPVACDVAMNGLVPAPKMSAAANLCTLAGINWVRDRLSWAQLEPRRGEFAKQCAADLSLAKQVAAGLMILQVNHSSPPWASDRKRFPVDLREALRFYRELARRWQGKVLAFEPWNEADAPDFGNHTGSEIATMQKASYLGLKAGNPKLIVCQNAFTSDRRPDTLADFQANRAWPYFETFNHHNYEPFEHYADHYAAFRGVSAGRPMWLTECCLPVSWSGDKSRQEPTAADLRVQAERVFKIYALSIHEGSAATFYFVLPHYVEKQLQFGLLHADLTPRPGYVALAAVGRLLADARPLGRLKTAGSKLQTFVFRAKPDGIGRTVIVAWTSEGTQKLALPLAPVEVYDFLGRIKPTADRTIGLSTAPAIVVLPENAAAKLEIEPPPAPAPWLEGAPSPIVLQAALPQSRGLLKQSAYRVTRGAFDRIPIYVYNLGSDKADGRLVLDGPKGWGLKLPDSVKAAPGERVGLGLTMDVPESAAGIETITIEGDFQAAGKAVLSFRLLPEPR
jgi:hypothetical protein